MPETPFKVLRFLICDDIRQEKSEKFILIGVYADTILGTTIPLNLRALSLFCQIKLHVPDKIEIGVTITMPSGQKFLESSGFLQATENSDIATIAMSLERATLPEEGVYRIVVTGNEHTEEAGNFTVKKINQIPASQAAAVAVFPS